MGEIYPPHKTWMMKRADQRACALVVNAQAIADLAKRLEIRHEAVVMPNILDVEEFDRLAAEPFPSLPDGGGALVGLVARLDSEKDIGTFIRGVAQTLEHHPDVHAVIAGDGVEREEH